MTYLVAGAEEVDAGKTTFSVGLVSYLDGVGFKPRAGNDYWYHHEDCLAALDDATVYGKDARQLAAACDEELDPTAINVLHRLWRPAPGETGLLGREGRRFVLDRVGDEFVVNANATIPDPVASALPLENASRVDSVTTLNGAIRDRHLRALDALAQRIQQTPSAVVESYGDVARPLRDLEPNRVAVVEPGRVRIYDGQRYVKAADVVSGSPVEGQLEEVVPDVVDPLDPIDTVALPPLEAETQRDPQRVANAYEPAYRALLA